MGENCGGGELWLCDVDSDSDEVIIVDGRDVRWATRGEIGQKLVTRDLVPGICAPGTGRGRGQLI